MRVILQRVRKGSVSIDGKLISEIKRGFVLLVGIGENDKEEDSIILAEKCATLRVFEDENGKMNLSLREIEGEILAVSQFTLYADIRKGRRPSFTEAGPPSFAEKIFEKFVTELRKHSIDVKTGVFGAKMVVSIENDGPVTLILESKGGKII